MHMSQYHVWFLCFGFLVHYDAVYCTVFGCLMCVCILCYYKLFGTKSMAMWGNHIQRVKIVVNDIIEQVTDFKYLGYRISEYGNDLEDKLQTYKKINRAIQRHFGKQMNKETKLRIHNITAEAVLKFGNEAWVLKKREEQRLEAAQMKFLRHLLGITKLDKEKN